MSSRYTRSYLTILDGGSILAHATCELAAMQIVNALRAIEDVDRRKVTAPITFNTCRARQEGDEMACACGLRWAVDDAQPPLCVHRAPRA